MKTGLLSAANKPGLATLGANALLALAYTGTGLAGLRFEFFHVAVTTVWPPSGIALAALLMFGLRLAPGVAIGAFAVSLSSSGSLIGALGVSVSNTLAATAGALALTRFFRFDVRLARLRDMVALLLVGAAASPLIAATLGPLMLLAGGAIDSAQYARVWSLWWLGDALGVIVFTPLILAWYRRAPGTSLRDWQATGLILAQALTTFLVFHNLLGLPFNTQRAPYVLLPCAIWLAVGYPLRYTATSNFLLCFIAIAETAAGLGPFAGVDPASNILLLHMYLLVVAFTTLLVAGVNAERNSTISKARKNAERFRHLSDLSADWYWEQDAALKFTFVSVAIDAISGIDPNWRLGKRRWEIPGLQFDPQALADHKKLLAERKPFRDFRYVRRKADGQPLYISVSGTPLFDADGAFTGYRGIGREVTAEVVAEQRVARLRDFYAALSRANGAIIHITDERKLLGEICDAAVTYGQLIFARIGLINVASAYLDDVATAGRHQGYPQKAPISINPDIPEGQGPAGIALRTDTPYIGNDVLSDQRNSRWHAAMLEAGVESMVVFPLHRGGRVVGSLHLYAAEKNWFDQELVDLVTELAANISFALDNFEREAARQSAEKALRESERRFRDIADAAGEFVWENDLEGRFTYVSPRAVDYTGYAAEELVGRTAIEFMPPGEGERIRQWLAENTKPDRSFRGMEHMFESKSGEVLWMQVSAVSIWDENGKPLGQRGTTRDISAIKQSEARISYLATRDPLTELPNRLLFNDRLEQGIIASRRKADKLGVLFLDLDRFKNINDSLGHHVGDLLLKEVAARMASCIRKGDTLSRLGGDEFVVTLEGLAHAEDAAQVALKIITALRRPLCVADHTLNTSCSIGISIFPDDAEDSHALMKNADTAMYHAKEQGRNNFQFFSPEMNLRAVERHRLETELRLALEQEQFVLHYQPQADIRDGRLVGMEALIRWQHPQRGLVPPNSFIPVAEESGLIEQIGRWALRTACEQIQRWHSAGLPIVKIAVNISARQFTDPKDFADDVTRLLNAVGLDPRYLELEMTESMLLKNVDENVAVLRKLGVLGTSLAVDDFGTGYSSLAYLKQLPIDTLKIDRTFVRDIENDADDAAIIKAIIAMAHSLGLRVTAEGVETQGQLAALRKLRCDHFQGYLLSRPIPADEFARRFLNPDVATHQGTTTPGRTSAANRSRKA